MSTELLHSLDKGAARLAELDHTGLQVIQWTFHETICFFVVCQEVMPERVLDHPKKNISYRRARKNAVNALCSAPLDSQG